MKKIVTIVMLTICLLVLVYALCFRTYTVNSLDGQSAKTINAAAFNEVATYDGLMLKDGKTYGTASLMPEILQVKDCST